MKKKKALRADNPGMEEETEEEIVDEMLPVWYDGKHLFETLFCHEYLADHPMICVNGKKKLRDYLLDILNQSSKLSEASRNYVDSYIAKRFPSFESLHDNASVTATTMTYDDDQWKKPDFFEAVASTILDEGKNHFGVDSHLKELLEIGLDLLHGMK